MYIALQEVHHQSLGAIGRCYRLLHSLPTHPWLRYLWSRAKTLGSMAPLERSPVWVAKGSGQLPCRGSLEGLYTNKFAAISCLLHMI